MEVCRRHEHEPLGERRYEARHLSFPLVGLLTDYPPVNACQDIDNVLLVAVRLDQEAELF